MVKPNWDTEELIENWTLLPTELELVRNKVGGNQIGFALLLKHFQIFTCFPDEKSSIPQIIISYIANQLKIPESSYSDYDWQGRTAKVYRVEIRSLFNFRVATVQDSVEMSDWLIKEVLPHEQKFESLVESVYQRWRELQIEPPTSGRIERLIRSAISQYESEFCYHTLNQDVTIIGKKGQSFIRLSPIDPAPEPINLKQLKGEINRIWEHTSLLDILKETDLRVDFTRNFTSMGTREIIDRETLQKRLLLCLYGMGTNTGLKRINTGINGENYQDLLYVRRRYIHKDQLRSAIGDVINAIFSIRLPHIWGEGTTTCASDSKHFGAWDQNLLTQYHLRYGGRGVMIYWHVEKKSTCIYSQLKTCSSSEVAAMIEGVLRHCTNMNVQKNYVDSHGQSEVAFAFTHLLGFQLMPRLKRIKVQKLYRPHVGQSDAYPNLQPILTRPINWDLIRQQYDQMVKFTTALKLGTAETESILKRFSKNPFKHPTYLALLELGRVIKTIFLCQYLDSGEVRREVNEGLNVVERWNGVNDFIFYGKGGEFASNRLESQELSVLSLHLLQICLVYVNTLMIQSVLEQKHWQQKLTEVDKRAITPLIFSHVNPYGTFKLDLNERIAGLTEQLVA